MARLIPEANINWFWKMDTQNDKLCLSLGDIGYFKSAITTKQLNNEFNQEQCAFSVEDASLYTQFVELLESSPIWHDQEFCFVTILNAVAAIRFHKEIASKNWLYAKSNFEVAENESLARVKTQSEESMVFILERTSDSAYVILLNSLDIPDNKPLAQFSLQKVMNNRLHPLEEYSR